MFANKKQMIIKALSEIKEKEKHHLEQEIKNTTEKEKQRIIKELQNSRAKEMASMKEKRKMEEVLKEVQKKQVKNDGDKQNSSTKANQEQRKKRDEVLTQVGEIHKKIEALHKHIPTAKSTTTKLSKETRRDDKKPISKLPKVETEIPLLDAKWLYENENDIKNMNNKSIGIMIERQAQELRRLQKIHQAAMGGNQKDLNPSDPSSGSDSDDENNDKENRRKPKKKDEGGDKRPPSKGKDEGGYEGDKESGRHSKTARSITSSRDEKEFLKLSFLNNAIPKFDPHAGITKHYQFLQICTDYLNNPNVRNADLMSVILAKLPADNRDWFRKWFAKGEYDTFVEAFRRKYIVTIWFAEFNRHLDEFRFDENQGAIKNGRRLRAYATPLLALLPNDVDRQRAEIAILEKFRNCLSSTECIQINMEAPNRVEPTNLNDYLELIDQLEGRTITVVQIQRGATHNRLQYKQDSYDDYDTYPSREKKGGKIRMKGGTAQEGWETRDKTRIEKIRIVEQVPNQTTMPRPAQVPYNPNDPNNHPKPIHPNTNHAQLPRMELMPGEVLICEYCTNKGHSIQDCRIRRRANNEPVEPAWRCRICNQIGQHYTQDCPHKITITIITHSITMEIPTETKRITYTTNNRDRAELTITIVT